MRKNRRLSRAPAAAILITLAASGCAGLGSGHGPDSGLDSRQLVEMPAAMQAHMLGNMRDHLAAIDEILGALAGDEFDRAGDIAEFRLGMSSLRTHGAGRMAGHMPEGMRAVGTRMHRAASRFAVVAQTGESEPAVAALAKVTAACVACHSAYRIR